MSTAQGFYEVYKALPKKIQKEVKQLIESEETVQVAVSAIENGLKEVKLIQEGELPRKTFADFKRELANGK